MFVITQAMQRQQSDILMSGLLGNSLTKWIIGLMNFV